MFVESVEERDHKVANWDPEAPFPLDSCFQDMQQAIKRTRPASLGQGKGVQDTEQTTAGTVCQNPKASSPLHVDNYRPLGIARAKPILCFSTTQIFDRVNVLSR